MKFIFSLVVLALSSVAFAAPSTGSNLEIFRAATSWVANVAPNGNFVSDVYDRKEEKLVVRSKEDKILFETKPRLSSWVPVTAFSRDSSKLYFTERDRDVLMVASRAGETILGRIAIDRSVYLSEIIPTPNPDFLILRYSERGYRGNTTKVALFSLSKAANVSVINLKSIPVFIRFLNDRYLVMQTHKGAYGLYDMTPYGLVFQGQDSGSKDFDYVTLDTSPQDGMVPGPSFEEYSTVLGYVDEPRLNQPMKVGIWNLHNRPGTTRTSTIVELPYRYKHGSYPHVESGFLMSTTEAVVLVKLEGEKKLLKVDFSTGQVDELLTSTASEGQYGMNLQSKAFWSWDTVVRLNP